MKLTPGISLILWGLPRILVPPCIAYIACDWAGLSLPWIILACLISTPAWITVTWKWYDIQLAREMRQHGAQAVPTWGGKWPGNIDLLREMMEVKANGYLGDRLDDAMENFGNVFNTKFLGFDRVRRIVLLKLPFILMCQQVWTSDPRHIKLVLATDFDGYAKVFKPP